MSREPYQENLSRLRAHYRDNALTKGQLALALTWALFHVHTSIPAGERAFTDYVRTGIVPRALHTQREHGLLSISKFVSWLDVPAWQRSTTRIQLQSVVDHVYGLSFPKASWALTSLGIANVACIDVHIARKYMLCSQDRTLDSYIRTVRHAYGEWHGSGDKQWRDFMQLVPGFQKNQHTVWFHTINTLIDKERSTE